mgnify:FL=1
MKGIMIDCSRNAVMTPEAIKRFVNIISALGYDTLMLYTEDTYEVDGEPLFGYQRGRYSKDELRDVDNYCFQNNVELVPCIQTLAHLNSIFKWSDEYEKIRDYDDILLVDDERTYQLIDRMFSSLASCLRSRRIHIGMDEAYMVGLGKYLEKHGFKKRFDIINRHLHKVCAIAEKYGFSPMIWSDMFCKLATQSGDYYGNIDIEKIRQQADLPQNITLVYWDYYSTDYDRYEKMIKGNREFNRPIIFAGGAWTWKGFSPDNSFSMSTTKLAFKACNNNSVKDIFLTAWGDDGGECSRFAILPALTYAACNLKNDIETVKEEFKKITNMNFDDFMLLDKLDKPSEKLDGSPSKYLLYNDPNVLKSYTNHSLPLKASLYVHSPIHYLHGVNSYYKNLMEQLKTVKPSNDYKPMFDFYISLCDALSIKSELGIQTRMAYESNDKKRLLFIAENNYSTVITKIEKCYTDYRKLWFYENKPYGFEIQDIRFGGLIKRIASCKDRLIEYCNGNCDTIPELEEKPYNHNRGTTWARIVTAGVISHIV